MKFSFDIERTQIPHTMVFRILVCGNFAPKPDQRKQQTEAVDRQNFSEVFSRLAPELTLDIRHRSITEDNNGWLRIRFASIKDFTPAHLIRSVPELQRLDRLRGSLDAVLTGKQEVSSITGMLREYESVDALAEPLRLCKRALRHSPQPHQAKIAPPPQRESEDSTVDNILDMVALPEAYAAKTDDRESSIGQVIKDIAKGSAVKKAPDELGQAHRLITEMLGQIIDDILHHKNFQALEATWRGLKFLVDRTDFRQPIKIQILDTPREKLLQALADHRYSGDASPFQPDLVVANFNFDNQTTDLELLEALAQMAADRHTPILFSVGRRFIDHRLKGGFPFFSLSDGLRNRPGYENWNGLRNREAARWLSACANPFLLRAPYQPGAGNSTGLSESIDTAEHYLWGNPAWAVACAISTSLARTGWPTEITGTEGGRIENLPMPDFQHQGALPGPLAWQLPEETAQDMARAGLIPLAGGVNLDFAMLRFAPTVHYPAHYSDGPANRVSRLMSSLPYQLLTARVISAVSGWLDELGSTLSPQELQQALERYLLELLANTGPGAAVSVGLAHSDNDQPLMMIKLQTGHKVMNGIELQFSVGI